MIAYADACEKAKAMFTEAGYKTWQTLVMELPDKWRIIPFQNRERS